ncbi:MAG TPA: 50S ribosomal protein L11 methyltransferase [Acidimicrobiales bacterium]
MELAITVATPHEHERELAADALWALGATAVVDDPSSRGRAVVGGFACADDATAALAALRDRWAVAVLPAADDSWADAWRAWAKPVTVGRLTIRPAWIDGDGIAIEPGRSFGTGSHPSTRLALAALDRGVSPGTTVLDVGTGTGVLAIAGAVLGASRVVAIDVDAGARAVAAANVAANGCAGVVTVDHRAVGAIRGRFDVVVANLGGVLAPLAIADQLASRVAPGGALIVSGLLAPDAGGLDTRELERALGAPVDRSTEGDWIALTWRDGG